MRSCVLRLLGAIVLRKCKSIGERDVLWKNSNYTALHRSDTLRLYFRAK